MNTIRDILSQVRIESIIGDLDTQIKGIAINSNKVCDGFVFIAQKGSHDDGHKYITEAINQGAIAIVCEKLPERIDSNIRYVKVENTLENMGLMASNYYDKPSKKIKVIGITGTNGKTTVASLLYRLFTLCSINTGLISTVKNYILTKEFIATHTTPDALELNKLLSEMVKKNVKYCFVEVSSHAIDQRRIGGLHFEGGVFTNLTHDHLDYHHTFLEYRNTKKCFFDDLPKSAFALTNSDDRNGMVMTQNTKAKIYTYALKSHADYMAKIFENDFSGLHLKLNGIDLHSKLIGQFNAYNLLAAFGVARILGLNSNEGLRQMSKLDSVAGRFQHFVSPKNVKGIVDYAHTPDALYNVLKTINAIRKSKDHHIITVVGCGGNRDKDKRPMMGDIATKMSDRVIFTSDNPRNENPEIIIKEMIAGVQPDNQNKITTMIDRRKAIEETCKNTKSGDIILIAGKGHEDYQEIQNRRIDFNDFKILKASLNL